MQRVVLTSLAPQHGNVANDDLERRNHSHAEDQNGEHGKEKVDHVSQMTIEESFGSRFASTARISLSRVRHSQPEKATKATMIWLTRILFVLLVPNLRYSSEPGRSILT